MESATRLHRNRTERCLLTVHLIQTPSGVWRREGRRERQRLQISPRGRGSDSGDARPRSFRDIDLSPDVWGASPSRSAPPLGGQTALLVGQKRHLSGSECESGSGGVLWAAEWFVRERVWSVMSWVCIFRADVHLPLDLDQDIIFGMRKCKQCIRVWSVCVDLSCSTQPPPSSLTKSNTVKQ